MLHSYRPLMRFWAVVLLLFGAGVVAVEALGPLPSGVSGGLVSAPVSPAREVAKAPVSPAESAVSAAEVYFRRPPQALERTEYASLYSPYWQVRLSAVPPAWRQGAAGYFASR